jgi:hypothetical protein
MRLTVQGKLSALAGSLLAFLVLIGVLSITNLGAVNKLGGSMYGDRVMPLVQLGNARAQVGDIDSQILRSIADPSAAAKYRQVSDKDVQGIEEEIKAYEATFLVDAEKRGLTRFHPHWDAYRKAYDAVLTVAAGGDAADARRIYFGKAAPLYSAVDGDLAALSAVQKTESKSLHEGIVAKYHSSRTITLVALLLALAVGAGIAFLIARGIKSGVQQLLVRSAASTSRT